MVGQKQNEYILNLANQILPLVGDQHSFVFIKDKQHQYVGCNNNYARYLGFNNYTAIVGLTDLIINPDHAHIYRTDDEKVLRGELVEINNPAYFKKIGNVAVAGKIIPLKDDANNVAGILGVTQLIHSLANKPFAKAIAMLNANNILLTVNKNWYEVNTRYGKVKISKREVQCILFLFKSFTSEDIAQNLQLSRRSVESYLVNIKNKLNVSHKSEIVETIILGGLLEQL